MDLTAFYKCPGQRDEPRARKSRRSSIELLEEGHHSIAAKKNLIVLNPNMAMDSEGVDRWIHAPEEGNARRNELFAGLDGGSRSAPAWRCTFWPCLQHQVCKLGCMT